MNQLMITPPTVRDIKPCVEAIKELQLRGAEQDKDWDTPIHLLLTFLEAAGQGTAEPQSQSLS